MRVTLKGSQLITSAVPERDELNSRGQRPRTRERSSPTLKGSQTCIVAICATLSGSRLVTRFPGALPPAINLMPFRHVMLANACDLR